MKILRPIGISLIVVLAAIATGCGYNSLVGADEETKAAWGQVENVYQRRADLIPNLVATVKGSAAHEQNTLSAVTQARAEATQVKLTTSDLSDPAKLRAFEQAQGQLSQSLGRLLAVAENYPDLKANASFRDLQSQLEGTENRITVARKRYIDSVQAFNTTVRSFPTNLTAMLFKMDVKPNFTVENEAAIAKPPAVDFGKGAPDKKS